MSNGRFEWNYLLIYSSSYQKSETIKLRKLEIYDLILQAAIMLAERMIKLEIMHFAADSFRR